MPERALPTATVVWQTQAKSWLLTVVCKATFSYESGELVLAEQHEPITEHDEHWNDDERRSLLLASDLCPMKPSVDVVLTGHTFAPQGSSVRKLTPRVRVGLLDKSLDVHADRSLGPDGATHEGPPFARMRVVYERATGGPGTWNPVGIRNGTQDSQGHTVLPNVTAPGRAHGGEPAGFGPLARTWPTRAELAGQHELFLSKRGYLEQPFPPDLDPRVFSMAPKDQQLSELDDDAPVELDHLHPRLAQVRSKLPGIRPEVSAVRGGVARAVELRADTLAFDSDRCLCTLVWRGIVPLDHRQDEPVLEVRLSRRPKRAAETTAAFAVPKMDALPFMQAGRPASGARAVADALPFAQRPRDRAPASSGSAGLRFGGPPLAPAAPSSVQPHYAEPIAPAPVPAPAPAPAWIPPPEIAPPLVVGHSAAAALGGLAGASNAAVDARREPQRQIETEARYEGDIIQLLWFDPEAAGRVKRRPEWRELLKKLAKRSFDGGADQPASDENPEQIEERRDIYEVLTYGKPSVASDVHDALIAGVRSDGRFTPPLLLVAGEARFDFDEVEQLKAHIGAAKPLAARDEKLKAALDQAEAFLASPVLLTSPDVVAGMIRRVEDAFREGDRVVGPEYLKEQVERALISRRAFQRKDVFGDKHLRAQFFFPDGESGFPTYLKEVLVSKLPLFRHLPVRLLVEPHFQADQFEVHDAAFKVVALGRIVSRGSRPTG